MDEGVLPDPTPPPAFTYESWTSNFRDFFISTIHRGMRCKPFLNCSLHENPPFYVLLFFFKTLVVCLGMRRLPFRPWSCIFMFGFLLDYRNCIVDRVDRTCMLSKYLVVIVFCVFASVNVKNHICLTLAITFLSFPTFTQPDFFECNNYCLDVMFCAFSFLECCRAFKRSPFHILYPLVGIAAHQLPRDHPQFGPHGPEVTFLVAYAVIYCVASFVMMSCRMPKEDILFHLSMLFFFAGRPGAPPLFKFFTLYYAQDDVICRKIVLATPTETPLVTTLEPPTTSHKTMLEELYEDLEGAPYTLEEFVANSMPTMNDTDEGRFAM